jgi:hypothetical protein
MQLALLTHRAGRCVIDAVGEVLAVYGDDA